MLKKVEDMIFNGKVKSIEGVIVEALDTGFSAQGILDVMIETMEKVGDQFQKNEIFISEMLASALAMKKGIAFLTPELKKGSISRYGKCIIGTVAGDLHDIGKSLVSIMMESVGLEVIDLGIDVPAEKFIEAIRENPDCKVVGLSALLSTTMDSMREIVQEIIAQGLQTQVKIIVGGTPISAEFAQEIGADYYAPDAVAAARMAKQFASGAEV